MARVRWGRVRAISFDCYGTLVDWERGLLQTLEPWLHRHSRPVDTTEVLSRFAYHEARAEAGAFRCYVEVLRDVMHGLAGDFGVPLQVQDVDLLSRSMSEWPLFEDTAEALQTLVGRFPLAILSNVDDALFAATRARLGVQFDWVITSERVRSYKPSAGNFQALVEHVRLQPGELVHAAQSLFHDIGPAAAAGIPTVWVDRRGGRSGGATPPARAQADVTVGSLRELAALASAAARC